LTDYYILAILDCIRERKTKALNGVKIMNNKQNTRIFGTLEKINTGYFICDVNGFSHYLGYDVKFENSLGEVVSAIAEYQMNYIGNYRLNPETIEFYGVTAVTENFISNAPTALLQQTLEIVENSIGKVETDIDDKTLFYVYDDGLNKVYFSKSIINFQKYLNFYSELPNEFKPLETELDKLETLQTAIQGELRQRSKATNNKQDFLNFKRSNKVVATIETVETVQKHPETLSELIQSLPLEGKESEAKIFIARYLAMQINNKQITDTDLYQVVKNGGCYLKNVDDVVKCLELNLPCVGIQIVHTDNRRETVLDQAKNLIIEANKLRDVGNTLEAEKLELLAKNLRESVRRK
jgi:hypothetical protein